MNYDEKIKMVANLLDDLAGNHFEEFSREFRIDVFAKPEFDDSARFWQINGIVDSLRDLGVGLANRDKIEENLRHRSGYKRVSEMIAEINEEPDEPEKSR